ncbi:hypothetical protein [Verrucomicrobium spinosum]|uniref:hypothetical protein n=1 Tax=Verrucomicrobium spinosum TaxID=2736 RepID=UPI0001746606|nr:hypothetical protein [Verrucomicrobium spinosum]
MSLPTCFSVPLLGCLLALPLTAAESPPSAAKPVQNSGWVLVTPRHAKETVLLDSHGKEAHVWPANCEAAGSARLHPDGSILRLGRMPLPAPFDKSGLRGGRLQIIGWNGKVEWDFLDAVSDHFAFGDAVRLPNGNVLTAVLEYKSRQECEALGRAGDAVTDAGLYFPGLMEFKPHGKGSGLPVWKWSLADHVFQGRHPSLPHYVYPGENAGRMDVGVKSHLKGPVWLQPLEIDYHPQEDLVLMVMGGTGEVWVIDHSTTQAEAATSEGGKRGRGGDLLVRWRGPTPAPGMEQKSVVLSAEWAPVEGSALGVNVLRMDGTPATATVEKIQVAREAFTVSDPKLLLKDQTAPPTSADWNPLGSMPSSVAYDPVSQFVVLTDGLQGRVRTQNRTGVPWTHQNQRGQIKMRIHRGPMPGQECCGNATSSTNEPSDVVKASQSEQVKMKEVQTAPLLKARVYGSSVLKSIPDLESR